MYCVSMIRENLLQTFFQPLQIPHSGLLHQLATLDTVPSGHRLWIWANNLAGKLSFDLATSGDEGRLSLAGGADPHYSQ